MSIFQLYLYGKGTKVISYNELVNRELVLFSNVDNERSIPCLVDGQYTALLSYVIIIYSIAVLSVISEVFCYPICLCLRFFNYKYSK